MGIPAIYSGSIVSGVGTGFPIEEEKEPVAVASNV
jgi:hypothetical protein